MEAVKRLPTMDSIIVKPKAVHRGNRKAQYLIAYTVALATVGSGAMSSWPAPVMPKFQKNETDIVISYNEMAWMVAMTSPGFMVGSLACRYVADQLGRRATLLLASVPVLCGTFIVVFAVKAWMLFFTRFLWGCGTGMTATVVSLYLAEIADKEIRGSLTLVTRFMFNFGNFLMMCIGPFVSYTTLNYLLLAFPAMHIAGCYWIPESPYFCLKEGKVKQARNVLKRIKIYEDEKMLDDDLSQMQADVKIEMRNESSLKELFSGKKYRRAIIVAGGLKFAQLCTGQLILQQYLGLIMLESNTTIQLSIMFIIYGGVRFVTSVMSSILSDYVGRRPLLIYSFLGTGISLVFIGIYFFFKEVLQYDKETLSPYSFIPFAGIIACNIISTLGYYSVVIVVPAEIFPLNVKAVAMTTLSIFGGLVNFGEARGYQALKDAGGLFGVFCFLSAAAFGGSLFCALYVPETKGKSLREIQIMIQGDYYESDDVCEKLNRPDNCEIDINDAIEGKELLELKKKTVDNKCH